MLQREHSAILSTFIKVPVVSKTFVLSIFEWPFHTGFTVFAKADKKEKMCLYVPLWSVNNPFLAWWYSIQLDTFKLGYKINKPGQSKVVKKICTVALMKRIS